MIITDDDTNLNGKIEVGATKIGDTWLMVPPTSISIVDEKGVEQYAMLRSTSNTSIKTGRGRIGINMSMLFVDQEDIDAHLIPILAQFKRSPFLPVINKFLRDALYPNLKNNPIINQYNMNKRNDEIGELSSKIKNIDTELKLSVDSMKGALRYNPRASLEDRMGAIVAPPYTTRIPDPARNIGFDMDDTLGFTTPAFDIADATGEVHGTDVYWGIVNSNDDGNSIIKAPVKQMFDDHISKGDTVYIITSREDINGEIFKNWCVKELNIPKANIHFTSNLDERTRLLKSLDIAVYYGDSDTDIKAAQDAGVTGVRIERSSESSNKDSYNVGMYGELVVANTDGTTGVADNGSLFLREQAPGVKEIQDKAVKLTQKRAILRTKRDEALKKIEEGKLKLKDGFSPNIQLTLESVNISNAPGLPNSCIASFSFLYFNHSVYVPIVEYIIGRDINDPVAIDKKYDFKEYSTNISDSKLFKQHYKSLIKNTAEYPFLTNTGTRTDKLSLDSLAFGYNSAPIAAGENPKELIPSKIIGINIKDKAMLDESILVNIPGMHIQGVSVGYINYIPEIPILGQSRAAHQFIGCSSSSASIAIQVHDNAETGGLGILKGFIEKMEKLALYRDRSNYRYWFKIISPMLNLIGMHYGIIKDIEISTVDGSPDLYDVVLHINGFDPSSMARDGENLNPGINDEIRFDFLSGILNGRFKSPVFNSAVLDVFFGDDITLTGNLTPLAQSIGYRKIDEDNYIPDATVTPKYTGFDPDHPIKGVTSVEDGDTLVYNGKKIRLKGCDTFESVVSESGLSNNKLFSTAQRKGIPIDVMVAQGKAATEFTRALVGDRETTILADPEDKKTQYRGKYGRELGYAYVIVTAKDLEDPDLISDCLTEDVGTGDVYIDVQAYLIVKGHAESSVYPHTKKALYDNLQKIAKKNKRGIWKEEIYEKQTYKDNRSAIKLITNVITP